MRFFLDNDVDTAVRRMLRRAGHQCWTAAEAGLADAADDDLSVYADDAGATLVTHDREFTARRRRVPLGRHVRLVCREWEAATVLRAHLDELVAVLDRRPAVVVSITPRRLRVHEPDWR